MTKPVIMHPDARLQFDAGILDYERKSTGLGTRFTRAVDAAILRIGWMPKMFARYRGYSRFARVKKFPYLVLFVNRRRDIVVTAIVPAASNLTSWRTKP
jgi:hypothetical protein